MICIPTPHIINDLVIDAKNACQGGRTQHAIFSHHPAISTTNIMHAHGIDQNKLSFQEQSTILSKACWRMQYLVYPVAAKNGLSRLMSMVPN